MGADVHNKKHSDIQIKSRYFFHLREEYSRLINQEILARLYYIMGVHSHHQLK